MQQTIAQVKSSGRRKEAEHAHGNQTCSTNARPPRWILLPPHTTCSGLSSNFLVLVGEGFRLGCMRWMEGIEALRNILVVGRLRFLDFAEISFLKDEIPFFASKIVSIPVRWIEVVLRILSRFQPHDLDDDHHERTTSLPPCGSSRHCRALSLSPRDQQGIASHAGAIKG
jgi:hypothetical protein